MRQKMKLIKTIVILAVVTAALSTIPDAGGAEADKEAWEALTRKYELLKETGPESKLPAPPVISDDAAVREGAWYLLAGKYGSIYAADSGGEAISVELLSRWWSALEDSTLDGLIMEALSNNRDLRAARSRMMEARAALGISRASALPWLDSADTWTNNKSSENSSGGGNRAEITKFGIDASWEIDVFGAKKDDTRAAEATLEASHAALHSAWVTLSSEVAFNYLSLRTLQERLRIANLNLELREETLSMLASLHDAGLRDSLALNQAKYAAEMTRASIPSIKSNIEIVMNALAIMTGRVPGSLEQSLAQPGPIPKARYISLDRIPADTIRQRPDIRAAERALAAQISKKASAEKDLLPKFFLSGSIGLETLSGGGLFSGDSIGFAFGPRITLPIFHGGAIRKNIQVQAEREEQLLAAYEGTVLDAVAEVRNALAASAQESERDRILRSGLASARAALEIAGDKYGNGLTSFSDVINAQDALLSFEDQIAISEGQMTSNVVRIYKALGGGWAPLAEEGAEKTPARDIK
ncbi:MAG: TolC family protein [Synergistaceae bacterium]|jgi:NodT family efflux transporter outer membrane factor (OMF) lipoprotein|nr:TolC family protein [Synergistaceae bacterium]